MPVTVQKGGTANWSPLSSCPQPGRGEPGSPRFSVNTASTGVWANEGTVSPHTRALLFQERRHECDSAVGGSVRGRGRRRPVSSRKCHRRLCSLKRALWPASFLKSCVQALLCQGCAVNPRVFSMHRTVLREAPHRLALTGHWGHCDSFLWGSLSSPPPSLPPRNLTPREVPGKKSSITSRLVC